ncbi:LysR family transcriptional regulator [Streptomyces atratus]|uniref:LysR family transcriptional regulator n=1 Tax=Streptomyces atratus TaxID=1893 RepID=UPI0037A99723
MIQINRLEGDLGQPLLERAERGTAMKLTPFGTGSAARAEGTAVLRSSRADP